MNWPPPSRASAARRWPSRAASSAARSRTSRWRAERPLLMQGYNSEDIAVGIDEIMIRQPLGVCAIIAPFNFPGNDPVLVSAVRDRLRQHGGRQAVRESAAHHAAADRS